MTDSGMLLSKLSLMNEKLDMEDILDGAGTACFFGAAGLLTEGYPGAAAALLAAPPNMKYIIAIWVMGWTMLMAISLTDAESSLCACAA